MISKPIATMKNLFKNLMLVAVAAMAFTACTENGEEVNAVSNVTRYEFTANIAEDTRSGFAEKEEGATAYKSEWHEGDQVKIFVEGYEAIVADVTTEGKFTLELTDAPESFFMTVVSPAESWASEYTATIPAVQTPLANSVDPKAHLLQAQALPVNNGVADINMQHMAAYGKMTVNGVAFAIDHVVVDLKGTFYGYDREYSYTINATHVENNTFWFATEPIDVAEFTVTAYDAEGNSVAKTVDVAAAGKTMSFQYGRVGTFSVSGLEEYVAPAAPMFTSASYNGNPSDKVVKLYSDTLGELWMNFYGSNSLLTSENWINPGQYGKDNGMYFGGNYGQYKPVGYSSFLTSTPNSFTLDVSIVDGKYKFVINADYTNMYDGVVLENATFIGEIPGLGMPDLRAKLAAPSNVTYSTDGKTITLSWDAVTGADGYRVKLYSPYDESFEEIVTGTEYVYEAQLYNTQYSFTIMSYASDENTQYRSSDDAYAYATTDKDPNVFAEYVATDLYWDNGGYFVFVVDHYEIFRVKMNDADCPNHTTIKEGTYTAVASSTVPAGSFSVYQKVVGGYSEGWSSTKNTSTMSVEYVDGEYVIIVNYIGAWGGSGEVGYKGVPSGWDVPTGGESGGDEPVDPDPDQPGSGEEPEPTPDPETPIAVSWSYVVDTSNSGTYGHMWSVSSGDDAFFANVTMDSRSGYSTSTSFTPGVFNYHAQYADGNYGSGMWFTMRSIKINGTEYSNYDVDGTITVTDDGGVYTLKMEIYRLINGYRTDKLATMVGTI